MLAHRVFILLWGLFFTGILVLPATARDSSQPAVCPKIEELADSTSDAPNAPYRYILSSLPTISYPRVLAVDMLNHIAADIIDKENDEPLPPEGYTYIVSQHESVGKMFKMNRYHNRQWFTWKNAKIMVGMMLDEVAPGYPPRPMEVVGLSVEAWDGERLAGWARLTQEGDKWPYGCEGWDGEEGKGRVQTE